MPNTRPITYDQSFLIRLSKEQLDRLKKDAEKANLSLSMYVRCKLGLQRKPKVAARKTEQGHEMQVVHEASGLPIQSP